MRVFTMVRFTGHLPACSEVRRYLQRGRLLLPLKVRGLVVVHLPVHRLPGESPFGVLVTSVGKRWQKKACPGYKLAQSDDVIPQLNFKMRVHIKTKHKQCQYIEENKVIQTHAYTHDFKAGIFSGILLLVHRVECPVQVGGRDEVWDRETMFSQLAKRSPSVVVSG